MGIFLVLGNKVASCSDLEHLLRRVSKDQHLLRDGDVNQHDKMNYDAVERLCSPNVRTFLEEHVPGISFYMKLENLCNISKTFWSGSKATCFYLKLITYCTSIWLFRPKTETLGKGLKNLVCEFRPSLMEFLDPLR